MRAIHAGPRAHATLATWLALAPYVRRDTGEVLCTQRTLARTAAISQADVFYGLARLVEMGALLREGRGRYRVHPRLLWKGELAGRERAEAGAPELRLVEGGKVD
jgi:DNA-binding IclR family transcriptional regulator